MPIPTTRKTTEMPQKLSQRGPRHVRTSSYDSDPLHRRPPITDKSPKVNNGERRYSSPRSVQSAGPLNQQRKLGTRISDLENQLFEAQKELKNLKQQLGSANNKAAPTNKEEDHGRHKHHQGTTSSNKMIITKEANEQQTLDTKSPPPEAPDVEKIEEYSDSKLNNVSSTDDHDQDEEEEAETKKIDISIIKPVIPPFDHELVSKHKETNHTLLQENQDLKTQLEITTSELSAARTREEATALKLIQLEQELESRKLESIQLKQDLENVKAAADREEGLELEMKQLRVQTEQWKKAADAAAAILSGDTDHRKACCHQRCYTDKNFINSDGILESQSTGCGYQIYLDTSPDDDMDGVARKKGSGIKMFADLWRKKGQK